MGAKDVTTTEGSIAEAEEGGSTRLAVPVLGLGRGSVLSLSRTAGERSGQGRGPSSCMWSKQDPVGGDLADISPQHQERAPLAPAQQLGQRPRSGDPGSFVAEE
jgi:hypothetical protein